MAIALLVVLLPTQLVGCDPIDFPPGEIEIINASPLRVGEERFIGISFPWVGGSIVGGWTDIKIESLDESDIVRIENLKIAGVHEGETTLRLSASTIISAGALLNGHENKVYCCDFVVRVE